MITKKRSARAPLLFGKVYLLCSLHFVGAQATRTDAYRLNSSVDVSLNLSDVGLPSSVGLSVGVRYLKTESYGLTAKFTLCHFVHLLALSHFSYTVLYHQRKSLSILF